jgi:serine protease inhibitor ecotin
MKSLLAAVLLAAAMSTVAHAGECRPFDGAKTPPAQRVGMKA